jgi:hypothetical protein
MAKGKTVTGPTRIPPITDLLAAYNNALSLFNGGPAAGNYNALAQYMHTGVVVKKVARRETITGLGDVVSYLNNQMLYANPVFTPSSAPAPGAAVSLHPAVGSAKYATAALGTAYGTGTYQDANTGVPDPGISVRFCWTFVRDEITQNWLLANVFAHRTDL